MRRGDYLHRTYTALDDPSAAAECAEQLRRFLKDRPGNQYPVSVFTASFPGSLPGDEDQFEALMWEFLHELSANEVPPVRPLPLDEPEDVGFVFGGRHLFVVGMHPHASRHARRFGIPTLVFNALSHVGPLRPHGRFDRMVARIRERDERLEGSINPSVEAPRSAQFSGKRVMDDGQEPGQ